MPKPYYPEIPPAVSVNPSVATHLEVHDRSLDSVGEEVIVDQYENGEVLAFSSLNLPLTPTDWKFIEEIDALPSDDLIVKKAKQKHLMAKINPSTFVGGHVLNFWFPNHPQRAAQFQPIMEKVNQYLRDCVKRLFFRYDIVDEHITWRFTPNDGEPIHFDSYAGHDTDSQYVRLFVNMDNRPRIWGVSHHADVAIRMYPDIAKRYAKEHPNALNNSLTLMLPWKDIPKHYAMFAPGNCWLVNSQLVSHEIIYGRKLIACAFEVAPSSMRDPSKNFAAKIRKAMEEIK